MSNRKLRERQQKASQFSGYEVSARLNLSEAQLRQLLALCGASLVETTRAAQELSDRVTLLREVIETLLAEGRARPSPPPMRIVDVRDILDAGTFKP
jgi:hypothetical protein